MAGFPSIIDSALQELFGQAAIDIDSASSLSRDYSKPKSLLKLAPSAPPAAEPAQAAELARLVEAEIIPRLMLAHNEKANLDIPTDLGPDTIEAFARMVLSKESESLIAYIGTLLQSGFAMETIYMELMTPAARLLGDYWNEDSISFTDVTIGLSRLQQVVRTLGWKRSQSAGPDHSAPSALFVPATSEQHTFGLFIIEDSFRRAGWRTWIETSGDRAELADMVRSHWFDLLGFSASCDSQQDEVAASIDTVRKVSRNPGLMILVGGRLFIERPELVAAVGADGTAPSGSAALLIADKALRRLASNV
jgi:methanogenic corrinoid protein MtbC1